MTDNIPSDADYAAAKVMADILNIIGGYDERKLIKEALARRFGSLDFEVPFDVDMNLCLQVTEDKEFRFPEPLPFEEAIQTLFAKTLAAQLTDLKTWQRLAKKDRAAYRKALKKLNTSITKLINQYCDIESNRPRRNQERDELIFALKRSKNGRSFGEVARLYKHQTGKDISAKLVERIYKRQCEAKVEELIDQFRPDLNVAPLANFFGAKIPKFRIRIGN